MAADPAVTELAAAVRELFTLRPRPRAVRRAEWLDARSGQTDWQEVVGRLWATDAATAELDLPLVTFLAAASPPRTSVPAELDPPPSSYEPAYTVTSSAAGSSGQAAGTRTGSVLGDRALLGCGMVAVVFVLRFLVLGCAGLTNPPPLTPSNTPRLSPPMHQPRPDDGGPRGDGFTEDEVRLFEYYDRTGGGGMPPRYQMWVMLNRPKGTPALVVPLRLTPLGPTTPGGPFTLPTTRR